MKAAIPAFVVIAMFGLLFMPQAEAQRAGFTVGIAPTVNVINPPIVVQTFSPPMIIQPFVMAPVQPFMTSPVQPFGVNPFPPARHGSMHHRQAQGIGRGGFGGPAAVIVQPSQGYFFAAGPPPAPPGQPGAPLVFGTPRAVVVSRLGLPLVTVSTPAGETLYFNGGITVFIQNGQVARPR